MKNLILLALSMMCLTVVAAPFNSHISMHSPRSAHTVTLLDNGDVLIAGGILVVAGSNKQDWRGRYNHAEIYDTKSDTITQLIPLNQQRFKIRDTAILLDNGQVLLTAGAKQAELVDVKNGTARILPVFGGISGSYKAIWYILALTSNNLTRS